MAKKLPKQSSDIELNWFWNLTTKWCFFPVFAFIMSFLFLLIFDSYTLLYYGIDIPWILWSTFGMFYSLSQGIAYFISLFIQLLTGGSNLSLGVILIVLPVQAIFYVYFAVSIFKIIKSKKKENKILKKRIAILFLLILLAFVGIVFSNYYPINASFAP